MICPLCAAALPAGETICPGCGAELTDYLSAKYQPDLLFNEALQCMRRESYSDAGDLLCRAHALRPEDTGILDLWVRAEYASGNKKRALELLMDLVELDSSESRAEQLNILVEEYDREQADAGSVVKRELREQNDRLHALLDRLERRLDSMEGAGGMPGSGADGARKEGGDKPGTAPAAGAGSGADAGDMDSSGEPGGPPVTSGAGSESGFPEDLFSGGFPDFSGFSGMFPPSEK